MCLVQYYYCLIFYFLMYLWYFNVRKPTFLYYCSNSVSKSLPCCLKTAHFCQTFINSFPIYSLWRVAPVLQVNYLLWSMFCVYVSGCCCSLSRYSCTLKKKEQAVFVEWRSGHPCWLSWEPVPIITPKNAGWSPRCVILWFDIFIIGGILSARLTYMWPRTVMVTVHEQRVKIKAPKVFNLVMVRLSCYFVSYFSKSWAIFKFSCITFIFCTYCLICRLYFRRGLSYFTRYKAPDNFPVTLRTVLVLT